ncbi:MAG TPA: hypothetical protein VNE16_01285 [Vicinamibacterales bacterium]|nr:hypothetical protein [Vicinamibacterales bacterium]
MRYTVEMSSSIDPGRLRPSRLWRRLSDERRLAAARAFWADTESGKEQLQAVNAIAQQKKFRPRTVLALPDDRKARYLASMPMLSEPLAARALVSYHLEAQRPMMAAFLDALGIAHDGGAITDEQLQAPDAAALAAAVRTLASSYPREDVALYLSTLLCQDPLVWAGLAELPELDG